ncbi:hypothetical protein CDAR_589351 [Caerostris darwini]|uniref:Uncharacterized protein n=1 Tax=Caerostris darwini TaxID=1538125 RepID=A0AAV4T6G6_9ARAC|nr:hypothetical protein CDAR_589351 [Caerostris darwini]
MQGEGGGEGCVDSDDNDRERSHRRRSPSQKLKRKIRFSLRWGVLRGWGDPRGRWNPGTDDDGGNNNRETFVVQTISLVVCFEISSRVVGVGVGGGAEIFHFCVPPRERIKREEVGVDESFGDRLAKLSGNKNIGSSAYLRRVREIYLFNPLSEVSDSIFGSSCRSLLISVA